MSQRRNAYSCAPLALACALAYPAHARAERLEAADAFDIVPALRLARYLVVAETRSRLDTPLLTQAEEETGSRLDTPLLLAQAEGETRSDASPVIAGVRSGNGDAGLSVQTAPAGEGTERSSPRRRAANAGGIARRETVPAAAGERAPGGQAPAEGTLRMAQAEGIAPGMRVAAAAAPRAGQEESALVNEAVPDAPRPKRNRASATGNMAVAQGPNGKTNGSGKASEAEAGGTGLSSWRIPPIRWGGDASVNLGSTKSQGAPRDTQVYESIGLRADSYVYEPWFARVSGMLRVMQMNDSLLSKSVSTATAGSTTYTGNGTLNMFPMSRFPFTALYDVSDSRSSGELVPAGYTSRRLGLRQSYVPLAGADNYQISYDQSTVTSHQGGSDIAKSLAGSMSDRVGSHNYGFNFNRYSNTREGGGDHSEIVNFNANHSYRPDTLFAVSNMLNLGNSRYRLSNAGNAAAGINPSVMDSSNRFQQLNSFTTWRPGETSPLMLSGGARLYQSQANSGTGETDARTLSANAAATYTLNQNASFSGSGMVSQASSADRETTVTNLSAGANYIGDARRFGQFNYGWGGGATATRIDQSDQDSRSIVTARANHNINRPFVLAPTSMLNLNASQSFANNSGAGTYHTLTHSAGAAWNSRPTEVSSTLLGINATDSKSFGATQQHFQMVNLQSNGQLQFSRYATGGVNLTIQGTRQSLTTNSLLGVPQTPTASYNWTTNGGFNYQHTQAFGVPRLRYSAFFNANQYQVRTRFEGDINAPIARVNKSLEQRLDYNIGRTQLQLQLRVAEMENRNYSMLYFRLLRQFGAY